MAKDTSAAGKNEESDSDRSRSDSRASTGRGGSSGAMPLPPADLRCLQGVRAVASIGVVLLHCFMFWQFFLSHRSKYQLTQSNVFIKLASAGMVWVDVLFVLSACLAAHQLIPRLEDQCRTAPSCRQVVVTYWRGRAQRVLPAYIVANVLAAVALGPADVPREAAVARWLHFYHCPRTLWANALLIQNFLGNQACAIHLWTVALQSQFFLAFPLLLCALRPRTPGFRARLAATLTATIAAGTAWRLWAASTAEPLELPVADFAVDVASQQSWAEMLHATYLPTASRAAELAIGAGLGLLLRSPGALKCVQQRRGVLAAAALSLQAVYLHLLLRWHVLFRQPGMAPWPLSTARLHIALLSFGSPFTAVLVATTLLALLLHADPLHALGARILAAPLWRPLASLSYSQYLIHEQARVWVVLYLLPAGLLPRLIVDWPLASFWGICLATLAAGYLGALLLWHAVEKRWAAASS